ncbi:hypothetical protein AAHB56_06845, partial [Bacillus thuringiensis]
YCFVQLPQIWVFNLQRQTKLRVFAFIVKRFFAFFRAPLQQCIGQETYATRGRPSKIYRLL